MDFSRELDCGHNPGPWKTMKENVRRDSPLGFEYAET